METPNLTLNLIARIKVPRTVITMKPNEAITTIYRSPALALLISSLIANPRDLDQENLVRFNLVSAVSEGLDNE